MEGARKRAQMKQNVSWAKIFIINSKERDALILQTAISEQENTFQVFFSMPSYPPRSKINTWKN